MVSCQACLSMWMKKIPEKRIVRRKGKRSAGGEKRNPLPKMTGGFFSLHYQGSTATASGAARSGTAATTATDRIGGGNGKTGTVTGFKKINLDCAAGSE